MSKVSPAPLSTRLGSAGGRVLRTRWLMRAPIRVYKSGLGFLFGSRLLMLEHIGRSSGARRYVVLEVFGHPAPDVYLIVSGFGANAQWYRNLQADPAARVWVGRRRSVRARAERLSGPAADQALDAYVALHGKAWDRFKPVVEDTLGQAVERGSDLPILALSLTATAGA
ncbi:MAG TPA: nitroreductase family deazaflavin-dependent oxidoreductase [Frankiaceae bacterium]|nr:nitroreductase family deazaflavin-dependent oxidoreductase [Frankiaceae bacterium]